MTIHDWMSEMMLRTPLERQYFLHKCFCRMWPVLSRLASLYRRTAVRRTRIVAVVGSFGKSTTTNAVVTALGGTPYPGSQRNVSSFLARGT